MCKRSFIYIRQQIQFVIFQKGYRMGDTKEKILMTALQLFARDGYEAVSVRNIAEELGRSAIWKICFVSWLKKAY